MRPLASGGLVQRHHSDFDVEGQESDLLSNLTICHTLIFRETHMAESRPPLPPSSSPSQ